MKNFEDKVGFKIELIREKEYSFNRIALVSLKKAVKSFYETYQGLNRHAIIRDDLEEDFDDEKENNNFYPSQYFECYLDSIIYFHHFFEITIKDLLEKNNNILAKNFNNQDMLLVINDLINKKEIDNSILEHINTIEFSEALKRLKILNTSLYSDKSLEFLTNSAYLKNLEKLNAYRNRILHKGRLVLKFKELDKFIGGDLFPIVKQIFEHPYYKNHKKRWYNKPLHCKIDVFEEIIKECKLPNTNHRKIAVLKEMGRASYSIPYFYQCKDEKVIRQEANILTGVPIKYVKEVIEKCPVCGKSALVIDKEQEDQYEWIDLVKCFNCSFELHYGYIGNMSEFNLKNCNYFE